MDEGEGLGLKMEVYMENGFHTVVDILPKGLNIAPEGPWQTSNHFILLDLSRKSIFSENDMLTCMFTLCLYCNSL